MNSAQLTDKLSSKSRLLKNYSNDSCDLNPLPSETFTSAFLEKLYLLLSDDSGNQDYICWQPNGTSFLIKQPIDLFSNIVLPRYFKHNNLQSFIRQLNMYDFSKTSHDSNYREFTHSLFRKGRRDLLPLIKRKISAPKLQIANLTTSSKLTSNGNVIEADDCSLNITNSAISDTTSSDSERTSHIYRHVDVKQERERPTLCHESPKRQCISDTVNELKVQVKDMQVQMQVMSDRYEELHAHHCELINALGSISPQASFAYSLPSPPLSRNNSVESQRIPQSFSFGDRMALITHAHLKNEPKHAPDDSDLVRKVSMDYLQTRAASSLCGAPLSRQPHIESFVLGDGDATEGKGLTGLNVIANAATSHLTNPSSSVDPTHVSVECNYSEEEAVLTLCRSLSKGHESL